MTWPWLPSACTVFARLISSFVPNSTVFHCANSLKAVSLWRPGAKRLNSHFRRYANDCHGCRRDGGHGRGKRTWQGLPLLSLTLITSRTSIRSVSRAATRLPAAERAHSAPSWRHPWSAPRSPGTIVGPGAPHSCPADHCDQRAAACRDGCNSRLRGRATRWPGRAATAAAPGARGRGYGSLATQRRGSYYPGSTPPRPCVLDSGADTAVRPLRPKSPPAGPLRLAASRQSARPDAHTFSTARLVLASTAPAHSRWSGVAAR